MKEKKTVYNHFGTQHGPKVGAYIMFDDWRPVGCILPGNSFSSFRIGGNHAGEAFAIEIEISGRTYRKFESCMWVRINVTFPADGGPNSYSKGWLLLDDRSKL